MNNEDFVYQQILSGCKSAGIRESVSTGHALRGLDRYKKGKYSGKPIKLISETIKEAKKAAPK